MANRGDTWFYVLIMEPLVSYYGGAVQCPSPLVKVGITYSLDARINQHVKTHVVSSVHDEFVQWYSVHHPYILNGTVQHDLVLRHARSYTARSVAENVETYAIRSLKKWGMSPCSGDEWFRPANMIAFWWALHEVESEADEVNYRTTTFGDGRMKSSIYSTYRTMLEQTT